MTKIQSGSGLSTQIVGSLRIIKRLKNEKTRAETYQDNLPKEYLEENVIEAKRVSSDKKYRISGLLFYLMGMNVLKYAKINNLSVLTYTNQPNLFYLLELSKYRFDGYIDKLNTGYRFYFLPNDSLDESIDAVHRNLNRFLEKYENKKANF